MSDATAMIKIKPIKTDKSNIEQPEAVKKGILPSLPSSYLFVGRSGSGKSTNVANLLTNPDLLGGYFNYIAVFSDVACDDVLRNALKLPNENYITKFDEKSIDAFLTKMESNIAEMGLAKASKEYKICLLFDDILSRQKFLKSNTMRKLITANRHFLVSVVILSQYLKSIPPVIRQNISGLVFYPSSLMEIEKLSEENAEPNTSKKEFIKLVQHATSTKHSFLFINRKADNGKRIRKGYDTLISLSSEEK